MKSLISLTLNMKTYTLFNNQFGIKNAIIIKSLNKQWWNILKIHRNNEQRL